MFLFNSNEAISAADIRHFREGWNPEGRATKLDTGLSRYDINIFNETESLILGSGENLLKKKEVHVKRKFFQKLV
jgi:hypothetical protein